MLTLRLVLWAMSLHRAARVHDQLQRIVDAYRAGESLDERDGDGRTPLHHALLQVVSSLVVPTPGYLLLALGASPDPADAEGVRPLHVACDGLKMGAVRLLLALEADPERPDGRGRSPSDHAAAARSVIPSDRATVLDWLSGTRSLPAGDPLLPSAARDDAAQAALLLRSGVDPDQRDADGNTALHTAPSAAIIAALLALGADPDARNDRGETPLHIACRGIGPSIPLLMDNGADPGLRDHAGRLPVDGLQAQSYADDFYDGSRLEAYREAHIRRLSGPARPRQDES